MRAYCRETFVAGAVAVLVLPPLGATGAPSYARPSTEQTIRGRIRSIDGKYRIEIVDDRTRLIDEVELHQGTIINPTGITLEPGMHVRITGYNAGPVFEANEIDTPYHYAAVPVPVYYGPGWWYPGYPYGYGPAFSLRIVNGVPVRVPFHHPVWAPHPAPRFVGHPYVGHR